MYAVINRARASSGLMRPWYVVRARSRTSAYASTRALASSIKALPGCRRVTAVASAGDFEDAARPVDALSGCVAGTAAGNAGTAKVPFGCSPARRATTQAMGGSLRSSDRLVIENDSRTLMPSEAICPATSKSRNITRPSVKENIMRSPYCEETVLPWPYFRATVTGTLSGKSTTSRGGRFAWAAAMLDSSDALSAFRPQLFGKGRTGGERRPAGHRQRASGGCRDRQRPGFGSGRHGDRQFHRLALISARRAAVQRLVCAVRD